MTDENRSVDPVASPSIKPTAEAAPYPGIGEAVWVLVLVFVATIAIQLLFSFFPSGVETVELGTTNLLSIGLVLFWRVRKERLSVRDTFPIKGIRRAVFIATVVSTIGLTILLSEFDNLLQTVLPEPEWLKQLFESLSNGNLSQVLFLLALVAPLSEEFLFRGLILQGFLARYSAPKAVFWSAFLFAAFHLNPWQFAGAFVLGILFGWLVVQTGTLVLGLIGHAVANGWPLVLDLLDIEIRGFNRIRTAVEFQPWWMDLTGSILVFFGLFLLTRTLREDHPDAASPRVSL